MDPKRLISFAKNRSKTPKINIAAKLKAKERLAANPDEDEIDTSSEDDDELEDSEESNDDEELVASVAAQVASGRIDDQVRSLMGEYDLGGDAPEWAEDSDTWSRAKQAVDPEGIGADYEDPYLVTAAVYKRMGGGVIS